MATKDELVAFGQARGLDVDSSMLKSEIEAAISDAGYDPTTLGEPPMSDETTNGEDAPVETRTSSDAAWSTYSEVSPDPDVAPAPGRHVEQERGEPSSGTPKPFNANR